MNVFVVLDNAMGGDQYAGVHRVRPEDRMGSMVIEVEVRGAQTDPQFVFIAQTLDPTMDVHRFKGVYGDFETAHRASGHRGATLRIEL